MPLINVQSCIFLDHHECAKSGGYCLNNTLQCDKPNDARCEDGARCCILDNGTLKRESIVHIITYLAQTQNTGANKF